MKENENHTAEDASVHLSIRQAFSVRQKQRLFQVLGTPQVTEREKPSKYPPKKKKERREGERERREETKKRNRFHTPALHLKILMETWIRESQAVQH